MQKSHMLACLSNEKFIKKKTNILKGKAGFHFLHSTQAAGNMGFFFGILTGQCVSKHGGKWDVGMFCSYFYHYSIGIHIKVNCNWKI